jgi:opacity protein-like surface antigen
MNKVILTLVAGLAIAGSVQAQTVYVGATVSASNATFGDDAGYKGSGKIFGGVELNERFGLEAGYTDLRTFEGAYAWSGTPGRASADGSRSYLAGKASLPINEQVSVYGKLGVSYSKINLSTTVPSLTSSESKTEAYGALGAQYKLTQNVALIAEYERYGKKKSIGVKADAWNIGAKYAF